MTTTFPQFALLPTELRLKIWKQCLPPPRLLPITFDRPSTQYISTIPSSPLLTTCHESRDLILETYTKLILNPKHDSAVYINFNIDTLFFNTLDCSPDGDLGHDLALSPHRHLIQYCAIESQLWEVLRVFKHDGLSELGLLTGLKTMALVLDTEREREESRMRRVDVAGNERFFVDTDVGTVGSAIRHLHWHVESLRLDLKVSEGGRWAKGTPPHVQMLVLGATSYGRGGIA